MNYKYKAYICYRRSGAERDKRIAEELQQLLEEYEIPDDIKQVDSETGKKNDQWKVFRDDPDLPLCSDVKPHLREGLKNSEFLIVVCSPRLVDDQTWCIWEINHFKEYHGSSNNILAVVVEGDSKWVIPKEVQENIDERGRAALMSRALWKFLLMILKNR